MPNEITQCLPEIINARFKLSSMVSTHLWTSMFVNIVVGYPLANTNWTCYGCSKIKMAQVCPADIKTKFNGSYDQEIIPADRVQI